MGGGACATLLGNPAALKNHAGDSAPAHAPAHQVGRPSQFARHHQAHLFRPSTADTAPIPRRFYLCLYFYLAYYSFPTLALDNLGVIINYLATYCEKDRKCNKEKESLNFWPKDQTKQFTARQIAEWFRETFPDDCEQKKNKSPQIKTESDLIKKLKAEIGTVLLRAEPPIQRTNEKPRKYYFSEKIGGKKEAPVAKSRADEHTTQPSLTEHDLYPLLWEYLKTELSVYSKRIDERKAKNTRGARGNHWLYPDLVGLEGLSRDWDSTIINCAKEQGDKRARLWSFEVKLELNNSNAS